VIVDYADKPNIIHSALITGCKAWHLTTENENEYKASLKQSCTLS